MCIVIACTEIVLLWIGANEELKVFVACPYPKPNVKKLMCLTGEQICWLAEHPVAFEQILFVRH